jgi:hypothetical protein
MSQKVFFLLIGISLSFTSASIIDVSWLVGDRSQATVEPQKKPLSPVIFGQCRIVRFYLDEKSIFIEIFMQK